jgi:hypothetical protein
VDNRAEAVGIAVGIAIHSFGASEVERRVVPVDSQRDAEEQDKSFLVAVAMVGACCRPVGGHNEVVGPAHMEIVMEAEERGQ